MASFELPTAITTTKKQLGRQRQHTSHVAPSTSTSPEPPHRYHPHQAAAAASSGLQRCRRVGCCLLNLSLLTSTQHLISVSVPLPVPSCCSFFVGSYLKFTLSKLVFILLSIRTSSFWGFVRLRHHFELFRPMGLGSLVLGLRSLGLRSWLSGSLAHKTHEFTSKRRFGTCVMFEYISFFPLSASVWAFFNFFSLLYNIL